MNASNLLLRLFAIDRQELKSIRTQANIALNIVAASATLFALGYFLGSQRGDQTFSLLCGVAGAVLGLMVEVTHGKKTTAHDR